MPPQYPPTHPQPTHPTLPVCTLRRLGSCTRSLWALRSSRATGRASRCALRCAGLGAALLRYAGLSWAGCGPAMLSMPRGCRALGRLVRRSPWLLLPSGPLLLRRARAAQRRRLQHCRCARSVATFHAVLCCTCSAVLRCAALRCAGGDCERAAVQVRGGGGQGGCATVAPAREAPGALSFWLQLPEHSAFGCSPQPARWACLQPGRWRTHPPRPRLACGPSPACLRCIPGESAERACLPPTGLLLSRSARSARSLSSFAHLSRSAPMPSTLCIRSAGARQPAELRLLV